MTRELMCANCGKPFEAKRPDAKYCGVRCRKIANRLSVTDGVTVRLVTDNLNDVTDNRPDVLDLTHSNRDDYVEVSPRHFVHKSLPIPELTYEPIAGEA